MLYYVLQILNTLGRSFGKFSHKWMTQAAEQGIYVYPGMPNGTEIGQECDQLFSNVKCGLYSNRDLLWSTICSSTGEDKAELVLDDFGYILFGGEIALPNGRRIVLSDVFSERLRPHHIKRAREECGYCPATRSALESPKIRHEIVEALDGSIDTDADPLGLLISVLEKENAESCTILKEHGYPEDAVMALHRQARRVSKDQTLSRDATCTEDGTRERQDLLEKCSTAGQFFYITRGGGIMNNSDVLYSFERKEMAESAKLWKVKKEEAIAFVPIQQAYNHIMKSKSNIPPEDWKNDELRAYIR
jgi:hypothetical protein